MTLEDIGFYTLSDERAENASACSAMQRCELIITDRCNFKCPYCRGLREEARGDITLEQARQTISLWAVDGLRAIRFSGGEPTLHKGLPEMVHTAKFLGIQYRAISTNGSAKQELYDKLLTTGVNDFSISLDACCASFAKKMAGCSFNFDKLCDNIRYLANRTYVTVGVVLNEENVSTLLDIIKFASTLGVADIRIIPAAQYTNVFGSLDIPEALLKRHPILKFRHAQAKMGQPVRGLTAADPNNCPLLMDDSVVAKDKHYPCIIYLREGGNAIGSVGKDMRLQRVAWAMNHNTHADPICQKNCLDFCVHYNLKWNVFHKI